MYKNFTRLYAALMAVCGLHTAIAQTNPAAVSLPFNFTSQSVATLPSGVAVHRFSSIPTTRTLSPATGDLPAQGSSPTNNAGGWYYLSTNGIGLLASGTNPAGAVVVAINTTGQSNISVSWLCRTILNQASRDNSIALQYRIGTSGNFTNLGSGSTYSSTGKANGHASSIFTETLPSAAENQPVVQLRWIYWESVSTSGSRDKIAVDDIAISGNPIVTCDAPAPVTVDNTTDSSADFSWASVSGAASYEYDVTSTPASPSSGTNTVSTAASVQGLNANTTYYFHVRSNCGSGHFSDWTTTSFTTEEEPDTTTSGCVTPASVLVTNTTDSAGSFSWSSSPGAISYEYAITGSATDPASGINTMDTFVTIEGLYLPITYYFHVRSNCDNGSNSDWITIPFTTVEPDTTLPEEFTVMTYNLLNYSSSSGSRNPYYRTIIDRAQPDIVVVQELASGGFNSFLNNVLNFSGTTYTGGAFIDGPDTDNGIYFKSNMFQFLGATVIATDLRDINQYMLRHFPSGDTLIIYSVHLKAGDLPANEDQRTSEVSDLRAVTDAMAPGKYFLVCGDFNIYRSGEGAYQGLTQTGNNTNGKFNDIISMSGFWNQSSYAINHTQSPRTNSFGGGATGGMDDRFDMFLFSDAIVQNGGFDIVSNSYKAYGNDGMHYNQALNTPPYTTYDSLLQWSIHNASDHLPVIVKLKYNTTLAPISKQADCMGVDCKDKLKADDASVTVYPNPVHNVLSVKFHQNISTPFDLYLYDINGRINQTLHLQNANNGTVVPLDMSNTANGIYYLKSPQINGVYKIVRN